MHEADVVAQLAELALMDQAFERKAARLHGGFKRTRHGVDEGMVAVAIERVETIVEAA
jgi:hypothetical protein